MIRSGSAGIAELIRVEAVGFSGMLPVSPRRSARRAARPPSPLLLAVDPARRSGAERARCSPMRTSCRRPLADVADHEFAALPRVVRLRRREAPGPGPHDGGVERAMSLIGSREPDPSGTAVYSSPHLLFALPAVATRPARRGGDRAGAGRRIPVRADMPA
jgi:hypothetical protein